MDSGSFDYYLIEDTDDGIFNGPTDLPYNASGLGVSEPSEFIFKLLILGIVSVSITCACIKSSSNYNDRRRLVYRSSNRNMNITRTISNTNRSQNESNLTQFLLDHTHPNTIGSDTEYSDSETCPICIEPFNESEDNLILDCKHKFHVHCILSWFEKDLSCPICRKELNI